MTELAREQCQISNLIGLLPIGDTAFTKIYSAPKLAVRPLENFT